MSINGSKIDSEYPPKEYSEDDVDALAQSVVQFHDKIVAKEGAYDTKENEKAVYLTTFIASVFECVFGEFTYSNYLEQIVALSCKIAAHQAFPDANKRTAIKTLTTLLMMANRDFDVDTVFSKKELEDLALEMAETRSIEDEKAIANRIIERLS